MIARSLLRMKPQVAARVLVVEVVVPTVVGRRVARRAPVVAREAVTSKGMAKAREMVRAGQECLATSALPISTRIYLVSEQQVAGRAPKVIPAGFSYLLQPVRDSMK